MAAMMLSGFEPMSLLAAIQALGMKAAFIQVTMMQKLER